MNKVFQSVWNTARRERVVTSELGNRKHSKGRKSAAAVCAAAAILVSGAPAFAADGDSGLATWCPAEGLMQELSAGGDYDGGTWVESSSGSSVTKTCYVSYDSGVYGQGSQNNTDKPKINSGNSEIHKIVVTEDGNLWLMGAHGTVKDWNYYAFAGALDGATTTIENNGNVYFQGGTVHKSPAFYTGATDSDATYYGLTTFELINNKTGLLSITGSTSAGTSSAIQYLSYNSKNDGMYWVRSYLKNYGYTEIAGGTDTSHGIFELADTVGWASVVNSGENALMEIKGSSIGQADGIRRGAYNTSRAYITNSNGAAMIIQGSRGLSYDSASGSYNTLGSGIGTLSYISSTAFLTNEAGSVMKILGGENSYGIKNLIEAHSADDNGSATILNQGDLYMNRTAIDSFFGSNAQALGADGRKVSASFKNDNGNVYAEIGLMFDGVTVELENPPQTVDYRFISPESGVIEAQYDKTLTVAKTKVSATNLTLKDDWKNYSVWDGGTLTFTDASAISEENYQALLAVLNKDSSLGETTVAFTGTTDYSEKVSTEYLSGTLTADDINNEILSRRQLVQDAAGVWTVTNPFAGLILNYAFVPNVENFGVGTNTEGSVVDSFGFVTLSNDGAQTAVKTVSVGGAKSLRLLGTGKDSAVVPDGVTLKAENGELILGLDHAAYSDAQGGVLGDVELGAGGRLTVEKAKTDGVYTAANLNLNNAAGGDAPEAVNNGNLAVAGTVSSSGSTSFANNGTLSVTKASSFDAFENAGSASFDSDAAFASLSNSGTLTAAKVSLVKSTAAKTRAAGYDLSQEGVLSADTVDVGAGSAYFGAAGASAKTEAKTVSVGNGGSATVGDAEGFAVETLSLAAGASVTANNGLSVTALDNGQGGTASGVTYTQKAGTLAVAGSTSGETEFENSTLNIEGGTLERTTLGSGNTVNIGKAGSADFINAADGKVSADWTQGAAAVVTVDELNLKSNVTLLAGGALIAKAINFASDAVSAAADAVKALTFDGGALSTTVKNIFGPVEEAVYDIADGTESALSTKVLGVKGVSDLDEDFKNNVGITKNGGTVVLTDDVVSTAAVQAATTALKNLTADADAQNNLTVVYTGQLADANDKVVSALHHDQYLELNGEQDAGSAYNTTGVVLAGLSYTNTDNAADNNSRTKLVVSKESGTDADAYYLTQNIGFANILDAEEVVIEEGMTLALVGTSDDAALITKTDGTSVGTSVTADGEGATLRLGNIGLAAEDRKGSLETVNLKNKGAFEAVSGSYSITTLTATDAAVSVTGEGSSLSTVNLELNNGSELTLADKAQALFENVTVSGSEDAPVTVKVGEGAVLSAANLSAVNADLTVAGEGSGVSGDDWTYTGSVSAADGAALALTNADFRNASLSIAGSTTAVTGDSWNFTGSNLISVSDSGSANVKKLTVASGYLGLNLSEASVAGATQKAAVLGFEGTEPVNLGNPAVVVGSGAGTLNDGDIYFGADSALVLSMADKPLNVPVFERTVDGASVIVKNGSELVIQNAKIGDNLLTSGLLDAREDGAWDGLTLINNIPEENLVLAVYRNEEDGNLYLRVGAADPGIAVESLDPDTPVGPDDVCTSITCITDGYTHPEQIDDVIFGGEGDPEAKDYEFITAVMDPEKIGAGDGTMLDYDRSKFVWNSAMNIAALSGAHTYSMTMSQSVANTVEDHVNGLTNLDLDRSLWVHLVAEHPRATSLKSDLSQNYGYKANSYGIILGADRSFGKDAYAGIAFDYIKGNLDSRGAYAGTTTSNTIWGATLYGAKQFGNAKVSAYASYQDSNGKASQYHGMRSGTGYGIATDVDSKTFSVGLRAEYAADFGKVAVKPHAGVRYSHVKYGDSSIRINGEKAFNVSTSGADLVHAPVGVAFEFKDVKAAGWNVAPKIDLGVTPVLGGKNRTNSVRAASFNRTTKFSYQTSGSISANAALGVEASKGAHTVSLTYRGSVGDRGMSSQSVNFGYRFSF